MTLHDASGLVPNEALCRMLSIPRAFRPEEVDRVLALADARQPVEGGVIPGSGPASRRSSEVRWLAHDDETAWLYDRLAMLVHTLNGQHWRFDLGGLEPIQVARYPAGGTYDWHVDLGPGQASLRKLSVTVQLSEADAYEGGDLQFPDGPERLARQRGDAVIFPSFMHHRVAPVTQGERWSVVAWVVGPSFR
ncbi:MAG: 2OG-Fe(II) oxygenase [Deltaproteobacteria bacterium]|nr:2OG-Fe(II) oxygenase [Deltaproteobacteria bacterium]